MLKTKVANKQVKVSVRAGFGSKLSKAFEYSEIKSCTSEDLARKVVAENIESEDFKTKTTAETLSSILEDPTSDLDMRLRTTDEAVSVPRDKMDSNKIENLVYSELSDLESLESLEMSASRIARGGRFNVG